MYLSIECAAAGQRYAVAVAVAAATDIAVAAFTARAVSGGVAADIRL